MTALPTSVDTLALGFILGAIFYGWDEMSGWVRICCAIQAFLLAVAAIVGLAAGQL